MLQRLIRLLNIFDIFKNKNTLPDSFQQNEKIARTIFSPINLTPNKKNIKANAFKPPVGTDEISVNRLTYTTFNHLKKLGKQMTKPEDKKEYFGFGILGYFEIIECNADIKYTPKDYNYYHADILLGYAPKKGETMPSEFAQKATRLAEKARLYKDPNPASNNWEGELII